MDFRTKKTPPPYPKKINDLGKVKLGFDAWFAGSQVIDNKGLPLPVFHGTKADFKIFEKGDIGFHFSSELEGAIERVGEAGLKVMVAHLAIKNPLRLDNDYGEFADLENLQAMLGPNWDGVFTQSEVDSWADLSDVTAALERIGYDGLSYPNEVEGGGVSWVAFRADQIRLIDTHWNSESRLREV